MVLKINGFFEDRKNYAITFLLVNIMDITSTLHLVAKYGEVMEKNPIMSFLMMKPYFSLVYITGYMAILYIIKNHYKNGWTRNFMWGFLIFYFLIAPLTNIIFSLWMVM